MLPTFQTREENQTESTMKNRESGRAQEHAALLEEALSRPGVRDVLEVYNSWRDLDQGLESYRLATKAPETITTTNYTNVP